MIDLTPLDVRKKRDDFKKLMRGYDPQEVDHFLELVAERLEHVVRENLQLRERAEALQQQVASQLGREQAVQDALVTAQSLRADIQSQAQREADHVLREAETEARRLVAEAEARARARLREVERKIEGAGDALVELERRRARFLAEFRHLLEREMEVVEVEDGRKPLEVRPIDLDLGEPTADAAGDDAPAPPPAPPSTGSAPPSPPREELELPTWVRPKPAAPPAPADPPGLSPAVDAEVAAQAEASTPAGAGERLEVPSLEEVLAEAGADLARREGGADGEGAGASEPPARPAPDTLSLHLDPDEPETRGSA